MNLFICCSSCKKEKDDKRKCIECLFDFNDMRWLMEHKRHKFWRLFLYNERCSHPCYIRRRFLEGNRGRLKQLFKNNKREDFKSIIIGCTPLELKNHLESQFTSEMTWENRGKVWHIDHIKPLAAFTEENEHKANLYTNLRPLLATENLKKSSNYDGI